MAANKLLKLLFSIGVVYNPILTIKNKPATPTELLFNDEILTRFFDIFEFETRKWQKTELQIKLPQTNF